MKAREAMAWVLLVLASLFGAHCYMQWQDFAKLADDFQRENINEHARWLEMQRDQHVYEYARLTGGKPYPKPAKKAQE